MYALLVLLVTGMSYVLWRAIQTTENRRQIMDGGQTPSNKRRPSSVVRRLLLYALLATAAFYTHYTVVFLIAAQSLFWAWILWRSGLKRVIGGAVALGAIVAVPLIPYTIPRLLAGAEANYYFVSPLTMLADVVRFFNFGLTVDFNQLPIVALNWLAFGLMVLGAWASSGYEIRKTKYDQRSPNSSGVIRPLFLLSWLLAVVFGLMAGSILFKPMYQGVRHIMVGSPAFLLLVAYGIWAIWDWLPRRWRENPGRSELEQTGWTAWVAEAPRVNPLAFIPLSLLLIGASVALTNLYTNPAFVKDDFRAIVRFIETRAGSRDVIVYNNAVLLPLHEHYRFRPDIAVTALPAYPQYATGQEPELAALAHDYDRVWFITDPPADKRDETKLIRGWLDANQTETINRLFPARTTEARVIAYATAADIRHPTAVSSDWEGMPALTGVSFDSPLKLPTLWVDLYWQGERPVVNESLLFTLTGPDGQEYFRHAHALLPDEDTRWDDNATNRLSYELPLPPGMPPGTYSLAVTPDGNEPQALGEVEIASTDTWPVAPELLFADIPPAEREGTKVTWPAGLSLASVTPWDDTVLPGNNLPVTLFWRVGPEGADLSDLRYRLEVIDDRGNVLRSQDDKPGAPWLGRVAGGALLREDTGLYFRPEVEPGKYRLRWTPLAGDLPVGDSVIHGQITVAPWPLETEVPPAPYVVEAAFGPDIRLHSYYMGVPTDGLLNVVFYWGATAEPQSDYTVFIHLVDENGRIVSQIDSVPVGGARPTTGWRAGEVITDSHNLPIPSHLPPGRYYVNAGLYNSDDGSRPAVTMDGVAQPDNQLRLTTLQLPEDAP